MNSVVNATGSAPVNQNTSAIANNEVAVKVALRVSQIKR